MNASDTNKSYNNEKAPTSAGETDYAQDPASGAIFSADYKRHEDLKEMLDSTKDGLKLEAMKRIIGMVAKGKDASDLFPAVVKNVVSKNIEVKKLVYVYLVRYAEEQQDLALLSISTFQKALKDPNQLIRASALRVLSSIRVPVIAPIMMLSIKDAVNDMSPYVRKTAAHAIPKLYSLDPESKEELIEVIEKLLTDKTTLVAGSIVMAFEEVCPERIDMIHKNYRKLCTLLVDVEEWGQVMIINMLTRYARTQFLDPNSADRIDEPDKNFYSSDNNSSGDEKKGEGDSPVKSYTMDADHRLLIRNAKPLLQSRNAAVVMSVGQLFYHLAPKTELAIIAKPMVRLLRSHREVQAVVLSNIATMTTERKGMFEPFMKSFFIRTSDPTHIRLVKLEILTNLATEANISMILKEFQTYVTSPDKEFAAASIQAIGRCACTISEVTEACLSGLMGLMSSRDETVVAESVVVIRKLLQLQPDERASIISHMAKIFDTITVPMARASILWVLGEYCEEVSKIGPDALRKVAKNFTNEEDVVKLQTINLAAKLVLTNSKQTKLLTQYVLNLAKYDQSYDIRDRARFIRQLVLPAEKGTNLSKHAKKVFLCSKPATIFESSFRSRHQYQLSTLSHYLNTKASGYQELPDFPDEVPDPTVRNVQEPVPWSSSALISKKKKQKTSGGQETFYSSSEYSSSSSSSSDAEDGDNKTGSSSGSSSSSSTTSDSDDSSTHTASSSSNSGRRKKKTKKGKSSKTKTVGEGGGEEGVEEIKGTDGKKSDGNVSADSSSSSSNTSSSSSDDTSSEDDTPTKKKPVKKETKKPAPVSNIQLLDFDDCVPVTSPPPTKTGLLTPKSASDFSGLGSKEDTSGYSGATPTSPVFVPSQTYDLLNRITGEGLSAVYKFTRSTCIYSITMVSVEITVSNNTDIPITNIKIGEKKIQKGMKLSEFHEIASLAPQSSVTVSIGIDFCDTTQPAGFELMTLEKKFNVTVKAPVGELLQAAFVSERDFLSNQAKLSGMHENSVSVSLTNRDEKYITRQVTEAANVCPVVASDHDPTIFRYCGKTLSTGTIVLVTVNVNSNTNTATVTTNCDRMVIGSMLLKEIKTILQKL